jgi:protein-L-isoaspartate(D-aspartate) O-methyltransferase
MLMSCEVYAERRAVMVATQIAARGVTDQAVLAAMRTVPREAFVRPEWGEFAYDDIPLPIGESQTISQPYIVAVMTAALRPSPADRVLEIGTGSGYAAAVLHCIVKQVYTVERLATLYRLARRCLRQLGYHNVYVHHGNGTLGWPEHAPYDGIVVTAGGPTIPPALQEQLALGGRLVMPVGPRPTQQRLVRVTRVSATRFQQEELGDVCFVPLIGAQGWADDQAVPRPGEDLPPRWLHPSKQERHHEQSTPHGQSTS